MRYRGSFEYRHADPKLMEQFIGLESTPDEDGRSFSIDERDAKMIVANLAKKDYNAFKSEFVKRSASSFRLLQDFEYRKKKR